MAQHRQAGLHAGALLDVVAHILAVAHALGHHHDEVMLAGGHGGLHAVHHIAVQVKGAFRDEGGDGAGGQTRVQGQMAGIAAHDLHHGAAVVGLGGIPQLIDALHSGIQGGIKADGILGGGDVVIDGAGDADGGDAQRRELLGAAEGAIAADDHQAVYPAGAQNGRRLFLALFGHKFLTAGGIQDGASPVDDIADRTLLKLVHVVFH